MRDKPQRVAPKLKAIRERLGLSQSQMVRRLNFKGEYSRISEWELGRRNPSVKVLLSYARVARIPLEEIVDDEMELTI